MFGLIVKSIILYFRLIWLQSIPKKKMIFFVRLQATPWPGLEVGDPVLAVRTSNGLTGLRGTSLLGTELSLTIM